MKKTLGITKVAPDDFSVHPAARPLELPPKAHVPLHRTLQPLSPGEKEILQTIDRAQSSEGLCLQP